MSEKLFVKKRARIYRGGVCLRRGFAAPPPDPENRNERSMKMSSKKQSTAEKSAPIEVRVQAHGHGELTTRKSVSRGEGGTPPRQSAGESPSGCRESTESRKSAPNALGKSIRALAELLRCICRSATVHLINSTVQLAKCTVGVCKVHRCVFSPLRRKSARCMWGRETRREGREGFYRGKTRKRASRGTEVVDEMKR